LEKEGEGIEELVGTQPDVSIRPGDDVRLENVFVAAAYPRIDSVGGDDQVGVRKLQVGFDFLLEQQLHAQRLATRLQDIEHLLAADSDKAMPTAADGTALEPELDVVPVVEGNLYGLCRLGVPLAHVVHRRIRE